jgi:hypothetical protein
MKYLKTAVILTLAICLSGCGAIFMYSMGARGSAVPSSKITSLYYRTSPDLNTAYVFYSIPGRIVTGMSTSYGPIVDARAITIEFGAVRDTPSNRKKYGEGIYDHYKVGNEWVAEFDIGDNDPAKPHQSQIKIFYTLAERDKGNPIPYQGIWRSTKKRQNKARLDNRP